MDILQHDNAGGRDEREANGRRAGAAGVLDLRHDDCDTLPRLGHAACAQQRRDRAECALQTFLDRMHALGDPGLVDVPVFRARPPTRRERRRQRTAEPYDISRPTRVRVKCWVLVGPEPGCRGHLSKSGWYLRSDGRLYKGPPLNDHSNQRAAWVAHIPVDAYATILHAHEDQLGAHDLTGRGA